ncbi:hypothetical protein L484_020982 [Morus notabilis]|uniref:Uncharacterized protein n=1 Tax=Morus notabilis TaxID=981085 RepID=W9QIL7_9ROSA|nr:hypothetical protein L484_020982 [Morus notabilis]
MEKQPVVMRHVSKELSWRVSGIRCGDHIVLSVVQVEEKDKLSRLSIALSFFYCESELEEYISQGTGKDSIGIVILRLPRVCLLFLITVPLLVIIMQLACGFIVKI